MKRLFKNDGTLLFGYWINTRFDGVPNEYHLWACEHVPDYDLQLERLKKGLEPIPGIRDGTNAIPVAKPPDRKVFTSKSVRPRNYSAPPVMNHEETIIQDIRHCIADGMSKTRISKALGINRNVIGRLIIEHGLPQPRDGRKDNSVPEHGRQKALEVIKSRKSSPTYKVKAGQIRWTHDFYSVVMRLHRSGMKWNEIARKLSFKDGGEVLCTRYHAHARHLRLKAEAGDALKLPPKTKSWWQRLLLWLVGDDE